MSRIIRRVALLCLLGGGMLGSLSPLATAQERQSPVDLVRQRFADRVDARFDVPYAGNENPRQQLDLFLPKERADERPLPLVVFIHGGGWSGGDRKGYVVQAATLAATGKYAVASVGYRLSAEAKWPAQIHDCKAAVRWLRGHCGELKLDPERFGATGGSAGGHLVTLLGLTAGNADLEGEIGEYDAESSRVTCVVNFCGPSDLTTPLMRGEAALRDDPAVAGLVGSPLKDHVEVAKAASPLTYVTREAAPIMTVHGTKDQRVDFSNGERLDAALREAGATSLLVPVVDAGHGIPVGPELAGRIQSFWDKYLRGADVEIATTPITP